MLSACLFFSHSRFTYHLFQLPRPEAGHGHHWEVSKPTIGFPRLVDISDYSILEHHFTMTSLQVKFLTSQSMPLTLPTPNFQVPYPTIPTLHTDSLTLERRDSRQKEWHNTTKVATPLLMRLQSTKNDCGVVFFFDMNLVRMSFWLVAQVQPRLLLR